MVSRSRTKRLWSFALAWVLGYIPSQIEPAEAAELPVDAVLARERRLDIKLSLAHERIAIGELLDRIGKITGVKLEADDRLAPISGYEVTAVFHDCRARDVLDALRATYHVPPDRWYWERSKGKKETRYFLRRSLPPEAAVEAREQWAHRFRIRQMRKRGEFFASSPERQALLKATDPSLRYVTPRSPWFYSFVAPLSEGDLWGLARGQHIELPVERLTPGQRDFIREEYRRSGALGRPDRMQPDELKKIKLYESDGTIYLDLGEIGAHGVLGGVQLDAEELSASRAEWVGAHDTITAPEKKIPALEEARNSKPEEFVIRRLTATQIFYRLAQKGRLNVIADAPPKLSTHTLTSDKRLDGNLSDVLKTLESFRIIWKHRADFFLFRPADWPKQRVEGSVIWPVLRELRSHAAANGGYLEPEDWLTMAELEQRQLTALSREFPDAHFISSYQAVIRLFAQMSARERTACARLEGAGWEDFSAVTRRRLLVLLPQSDARRTRMVLRWRRDQRPPSVDIFLSSDARKVRPTTVPFRPWKIGTPPRVENEK